MGRFLNPPYPPFSKGEKKGKPLHCSLWQKFSEAETEEVACIKNLGAQAFQPVLYRPFAGVAGSWLSAWGYI
jgi:hypothetical protein